MIAIHSWGLHLFEWRTQMMKKSIPSWHAWSYIQPLIWCLRLQLGWTAQNLSLIYEQNEANSLSNLKRKMQAWVVNWLPNYIDYRRKCRSRTSDNMDRWKGRGGKSQRKEEERRSEKRIVRSKKIQVREKVEKSRNTVFFQCFVVPEGRKVASEVEMLKKCTTLWREAHFEV